MENLKIRVRVGNHEFEAEGPRESVEAQFQMFKDLVSEAPAEAREFPKKQQEQHVESNSGSGESETTKASEYEKLFRVDGDRLSLHYLLEGDEREFNCLLLMLFGYRTILGQEPVLGGRLIQGLQQSGMGDLDRIDRFMEPHINVLVLKNGIRRGTKYRLTNRGAAMAKGLADRQLSMLP